MSGPSRDGTFALERMAAMRKWSRNSLLPPFLQYMRDRGGVVEAGFMSTVGSARHTFGTLYAFLWGSGTAGSPWSLSIHYEPEPSAETFEPEDFRLPTPDEVSEAFFLLVPDGALMTPSPLMSCGPPGNTMPKGTVMMQVGSAAGTDAGRRWELGGPPPGQGPVRIIQ